MNSADAYVVYASDLVAALQEHIVNYGNTPVRVIDGELGASYDFSYGIDEDPDCENNDFCIFID